MDRRLIEVHGKPIEVRGRVVEGHAMPIEVRGRIATVQEDDGDVKVRIEGKAEKSGCCDCCCCKKNDDQVHVVRLVEPTRNPFAVAGTPVRRAFVLDGGRCAPSRDSVARPRVMRLKVPATPGAAPMPPIAPIAPVAPIAPAAPKAAKPPKAKKQKQLTAEERAKLISV